MAKISSVKTKQKVNGFCVSALERFGYKITKENQDKCIWNHLLLLMASLAMFILSVVSLVNGVGLLLFAFHLISLFYKLVVIKFQAISLQKKERQKKTGANKKIHSPYHRQSDILGTMLFILALIMILTFFNVITYDAFFVIAVFFSIVMTLVKELLDGLVLLYNAIAVIKK